MRDQLEDLEARGVAPFAQRSRGASRRWPVENEGRAFDYRTHFQRDRDRIVYSRAFRRLRQKAQTGNLPAYEDHRRNRLTHTLEVAQLARTVGRALGLNEDLIEAIALGHDLGQPPFGPTGERALDDLLRGRLDGRGGPGGGDCGGFGCSAQTLRVVDQLEKRYEHPGLNLTDVVREGLSKIRPVTLSSEGTEGLRPNCSPFFEAQVVSLADRVAEALHDLDDALQSGVIEVQEVERIPAVRELRRKLGERWRPAAGRFMKANMIHRGLTHLLVTGAILTSARALARWAERHSIHDAGEFEAKRDTAVRGNEIGLSRSASRLLEDLERYLETRVRRGFDVDRIERRGRHVVLGLFAAYHADPALLEDHVLLRFKSVAGVRFLRDLPEARRAIEIADHYRRDPRFLRVVADHIASMTDNFALAEHRRLQEMGSVPIPSAEQLRREEID